jgi:hypothetical protein
VVKKHLAKRNVNALELPPYSPGPSLLDLFVFPRLKIVDLRALKKPPQKRRKY